MMSQYRLLFPFEKIPYGSNILLYGAGTTGKHYLKQLLMSNYCKVVAVIDKNYRAYSSLVVPVYPIDKISTLEYDYIVIAMQSPTYNLEIVSDLKRCGVSSDRVIYVGEREDVSYEKEGEGDASIFERDFSLYSGERQTGKKISEIRMDHRRRYEMAAGFLKALLAPPSGHWGLTVSAGQDMEQILWLTL